MKGINRQSAEGGLAQVGIRNQTDRAGEDARAFALSLDALGGGSVWLNDLPLSDSRVESSLSALIF